MDNSGIIINFVTHIYYAYIEGETMKRIILFFFALGLVLQSCSETSFELIPNYKDLLVLNEICPQNKTVVKDEDGDAGDWIEIYNDYGREQNLKDLTIKYKYYDDSGQHEFEYKITETVIIPANGYEIIWCDGKNKGLHTNFDLKTQKGGEISLVNTDGTIINFFNYKETPLVNGVDDVSLGGYPGNGLEQWRMFGPGYELMPTPKNANKNATSN